MIAAKSIVVPGVVLAALLAAAGSVTAPEHAEAQKRGTPTRPTQPTPGQQTQPQSTSPLQPQFDPPPAVGRETVQADVSSRSVAVTSSFTGTEILVFGTVDNSRQPSAESGYYDIVIVLEGTQQRLTARRKSNVGGLWINTQSITFESVPSYYAIVSTRPLEDIADTVVLRENDIGFQHVRMTPIRGWESGLSTADLEDFKSAVVRLKRRDGLYIEEEYGATFIGRSLFRASISLPAHVPVGPVEARVHLLREGRLLSTYRSRVILEREGMERLLHTFAFRWPLLYGIVTVLLSIGAGLAAAAAFKRGGH